jgi:hypothetical protein
MVSAIAVLLPVAVGEDGWFVAYAPAENLDHSGKDVVTKVAVAEVEIFCRRLLWQIVKCLCIGFRCAALLILACALVIPE